MSNKPAAKSYMLKIGHDTAFRRTVQIGDSKKAGKKGGTDPEKVQLVFEPGQSYQLTDEEVAGLQNEINSGLLVEATTDAEGRQRPVQPSSPRTDADSVIDRLEKKCEELAAENAELKKQLDDGKKGDGDK